MTPMIQIGIVVLLCFTAVSIFVLATALAYWVILRAEGKRDGAVDGMRWGFGKEDEHDEEDCD